MNAQDRAGPEVRITRTFAAPPKAVFAQWLDAEALQDWFAPHPFVGLSASADPTVGGGWSVDYQSPTGERFSEKGRYLQIEPVSRLAMSLQQSLLPETTILTIHVTFQAHHQGTMMQFRQTGFTDPALRDGMSEGWATCMDKLAARVDQ